ncbi:hypothetical protein BGZ94_007991 [Podila epigama]|nr:hypothetical protein BGZ94_007991 [Podila epigama]
MKFGKALETNAESMPEGWRPYVIHYKALKKKINAIVQELDDRGLPSPIIKTLLSQSLNGDMHRLEYSFDEDKEHLKTCIKVVLDDIEPFSSTEYGPQPLSEDDQLSKLLAHELVFLNTSASSSASDLHAQLAPHQENEQGQGQDQDQEQEQDQEQGNSRVQSPKMPSSGRVGLGLITSLQDLDVDEYDYTSPSEASSEDAHHLRDDEHDSVDSSITSPALSPIARSHNNATDEMHHKDNRTMHGPLNAPSGTPFSSSLSSPSSTYSPEGSVPSSTSSSTCTSPSSTPSSPPPELFQQHQQSTTHTKTNSNSNSNNTHARPFIPTPSPLSQPPIQPGVTKTTSQGLSRGDGHLENSDGMETIITAGVKANSQGSGRGSAPRQSSSNTHIMTTEEDGKRILVIELTADTAFFDQLGEEVSQLSKLQSANKREFEMKVDDLSKILAVVSSPQNKDMYTWREILRVYLDAQVFVGDQESDRSTRSSEKAQKQLQWFLTEMERSKLTHKFKLSKSKAAFKTFFQLNSDLITMKQFKELNQMAMTKILKKHDKRTNLLASSGFPKHLQNEPFYNDNISRSLTYTIGCHLVSIIPQPDDFACPICMSVAWKPIRLNCGHVFCVRCLVKAQRKKMTNCPVCRQSNSVLDADASNLDVSMMNFMKLYFPKEIKEKRKDSSREQAAEEMEAITGQRWSEVPDAPCIIM